MDLTTGDLEVHAVQGREGPNLFTRPLMRIADPAGADACVMGLPIVALPMVGGVADDGLLPCRPRQRPGCHKDGQWKRWIISSRCSFLSRMLSMWCDRSLARYGAQENQPPSTTMSVPVM